MQSTFHPPAPQGSKAAPNKIKWTSWVKRAALLLSGLVLVWSLTSAAVPTLHQDWEPIPQNEGWTQLYNGEAIALDSVENFTEPAVGEPLVLTMQVPALAEDMVVFFYTKDIEVAAYLDDALIYSFEMQEDFAFLKTPGNKWNAVVLPVEASGQTLRLELTSQFANRFESTTSKLYWADPSELAVIVLREERYRITYSFLMLGMALYIYTLSFIWKRKQLKRYFFALGNFYFATALWVFSMYGAFDYLLLRPVFSYVISMLLAVLLPAIVCEFVRVVYHKKSHLLDCLCVLSWGTFIVQFILQFTVGISMLDMLPFTIVMYTLCGVLGAWLLLSHLFHCKHWADVNFPFASILIMLLGIFVEMPILVLLPERTDLIGIGTLSGVVLYLVLNLVFLGRSGAAQDVEKVALEQSYASLQNTTLVQQMKAHFFYNTLNTISGLCKYDAAAADSAIQLFARYMRQYMHLINLREIIPFEQEIDLVKGYLDIAALRFPDSFTYRITTECTDFYLPPLCIQPIVENALGHGLRKVNRHGEILIETKETPDNILVMVTDNGAGFDVEAARRSGAVGMKNMTRRVELMTGGTVQTESTVGEGTKVTLTFPKMW